MAPIVSSAIKSKRFRRRRLLIRSFFIVSLSLLSLFVIVNIIYKGKLWRQNIFNNVISSIEENIINGILQNFQDEHNFYRVTFAAMKRGEDFIVVDDIAIDSSVGTLTAKTATVATDWQYLKLEGRPKITIYYNRDPATNPDL